MDDTAERARSKRLAAIPTRHGKSVIGMLEAEGIEVDGAPTLRKGTWLGVVEWVLTLALYVIVLAGLSGYDIPFWPKMGLLTLFVLAQVRVPLFRVLQRDAATRRVAKYNAERDAYLDAVIARAEEFHAERGYWPGTLNYSHDSDEQIAQALGQPRMSGFHRYRDDEPLPTAVGYYASEGSALRFFRDADGAWSRQRPGGLTPVAERAVRNERIRFVGTEPFQ